MENFPAINSFDEKKLILQELIHVCGENFKATKLSPNLSDKRQNKLMKEGIPIKEFSGLRDYIQHNNVIPLMNSNLVKEKELQLVEAFKELSSVIKNDIIDNELKFFKDALSNSLSEVEKKIGNKDTKLTDNEKKAINNGNLKEVVDVYNKYISKLSKDTPANKIISDAQNSITQISDLKKNTASHTYRNILSKKDIDLNSFQQKRII